MKYTRPPALDVSDATALAGDVISPKTFYAGGDEIKVGTITEATDLSAVDTDLVAGNIKTGITIFSVLGSDDVQDVSDADAAVAEVRSSKTFYSVTGVRKTGTLPDKSLNPASETVEAGYYAATTLSAVDGDLVTGSIKSGVTVFGVSGHTDVRNISDADAGVGDVVEGKTFYAVGGAKKTGTLDLEDVYADVVPDMIATDGLLLAATGTFSNPENANDGSTVTQATGDALDEYIEIDLVGAQEIDQWRMFMDGSPDLTFKIQYWDEKNLQYVDWVTGLDNSVVQQWTIWSTETGIITWKIKIIITAYSFGTVFFYGWEFRKAV